jgi:hypothetical protein
MFYTTKNEVICSERTEATPNYFGGYGDILVEPGLK